MMENIEDGCIKKKKEVFYVLAYLLFMCINFMYFICYIFHYFKCIEIIEYSYRKSIHGIGHIKVKKWYIFYKANGYFKLIT